MKKKIISNIPLVILGVFLIIYASFGVAYFQKQADSRSLDSEIALRNMILTKPPPDIQNLRSQLKKAEAELEMTLTSLPNSEQGIDIYGVLINLAQEDDFEILSIAAFQTTVSKNGEGSETILPYSLRAQGNQGNILDFISRLIQGTELLQGLELGNITIQNDGASPDVPNTLELEIYIHTWPDPTSMGQEKPLVSGNEK